MKLTTKMIMILLVVVLSGCNGATDYVIPINSNLEFGRTNPSTYSINYRDDGQFVIEPTISEVNWDDSYVIAKREHNSDVEYWIIDLKDEVNYGPLSKEAYLKRKEKMNIEMELKSVDDIKP
ncbi:DUF3997 domain-containing protein [Lysinibacillus halotolerans]|uniref:DUF3997 domain-containing protein n=1 Tax=Lysinibacillus halotolerans TaxID=1368476 RepID=A0A3M8HFN6_9BACI|nr:DUF3997 domain-containing protein [Lysinibacillus halotolerans]RND01193.1 DUF3997 domain-containing protein [Lysinibacillus halotolerans]